MIRNHEIVVKVSSEEKIKILKKAGQMGLKPSAYLRVVGLTANLEFEVETE